MTQSPPFSDWLICWVTGYFSLLWMSLVSSSSFSSLLLQAHLAWPPLRLASSLPLPPLHSVLLCGSLRSITQTHHYAE